MLCVIFFYKNGNRPATVQDRGGIFPPGGVQPLTIHCWLLSVEG